MTYDAMKAEYETLQIGPLLWGLLIEVTVRVARNYPPAIYNHGEPWSEEAHRELALEVALERLLGEEQLEYSFGVADEYPPSKRQDALASRLGFQVKRVLSHRRRITVVDRLHTRVRDIVSSSAYRTAVLAGDTLISGNSPNETTTDVSVLSSDQIRRGVDVIASIPRIPSRLNAERESKVYNSANLEELVRRLIDTFGSILLSDIRRILENILTAWVPTVLPMGEEDFASAAIPELELERTRMTELIDALASSLDPVHREVVTSKSQGISDTALAQRLGRSRPWVADRKTEVLQRVQRELIDELPEPLHDEAARRLLEVLSEPEETDS